MLVTRPYRLNDLVRKNQDKGLNDLKGVRKVLTNPCQTSVYTPWPLAFNMCFTTAVFVLQFLITKHSFTFYKSSLKLIDILR
jgi:hypothetical protein